MQVACDGWVASERATGALGVGLVLRAHVCRDVESVPEPRAYVLLALCR